MGIKQIDAETVKSGDLIRITNKNDPSFLLMGIVLGRLITKDKFLILVIKDKKYCNLKGEIIQFGGLYTDDIFLLG